MPEKHNEDAAWGDLDWGSTSELDSLVPSAPADEPLVPTNVLPELCVKSPPATHESSTPPTLDEGSPSLLADSVGVDAISPLILSEAPKSSFTQSPAESDSSSREPPIRTKRMVFTPASVATLTLRNEAGAETSFTITHDISIGRHANNDLVIQDLHVSGHHAKLTRGGDGRFEITDLNSSGGTFVNGVEVKTHVLASGDEIIFSTVMATFRYVAGEHANDELFLGGTIVRPKKEIARKAAASPLVVQGAKLTVNSPKGPSFTVDLKGTLRVGRAEDNDVIIADEHVSGRHAKIICSDGGLIEIVDLKSTCGTFVNGVEVQSCFLNHGDRVRFGVVDCVIEMGSPPLKKEEKRAGTSPKKGHGPMEMVYPAPNPRPNP